MAQFNNPLCDYIRIGWIFITVVNHNHRLVDTLRSQPPNYQMFEHYQMWPVYQPLLEQHKESKMNVQFEWIAQFKNLTSISLKVKTCPTIKRRKLLDILQPGIVKLILPKDWCENPIKLKPDLANTIQIKTGDPNSWPILQSLEAVSINSLGVIPMLDRLPKLRHLRILVGSGYQRPPKHGSSRYRDEQMRSILPSGVTKLQCCRNQQT
ncbi:hypothetical protein DFA_07574 [Cavenderia fasciculata]|uniref:Uncharacterized protein n=1 Tax=Cavenderia fasciculata TaxID=261658 RepID=F4PWT6_CACFS|nr:uncharacterized protein DFA_07574 [Cavenderia fasciculata]EGG20450.1 hypothetical protein DFA_07574 [Cavenderia fasciculata]|eukprot:XP_004367433.1 hypothetical protein DFA_07574 [Cavenderia fasciculata]